MRKTKKNSEKIHFANRSIERVGCLLDDKNIVKLIQANKLEFIGRETNRVTKWKYNFNNIEYTVVYDKNRKQIITIF